MEEDNIHVWDYLETLPKLSEGLVQSKSCIYCGSSMYVAARTRTGDQNQKLMRCEQCGWWTYWLQTSSGIIGPDTGSPIGWRTEGAAGLLRSLDLQDLEAPIEEVRSYLAARYESRFSMHPRLFELTVRSVFESLGFSAVATAYTSDGGIDVILDGPDGQCGVQCKRTSRSIEVEQLRALAGALMDNGLTRGVFVTTSRFRSGPTAFVERSAARGMPIELVDAERFLDALCISRRADDVEPHEEIEFMDSVHTKILDEDWADPPGS